MPHIQTRGNALLDESGAVIGAMDVASYRLPVTRDTSPRRFRQLTRQESDEIRAQVMRRAPTMVEIIGKTYTRLL